jgi:hypothetical protein
MAESADQEPESERREASRVGCNFPASLNLLFPEDSFTPVAVIVLVTDVSEKGVKVICPPFPAPFDAFAPREGLYAKLHSREGERSASLYCQVKWVRERRHADGRAYAELGLAYHARFQGAGGEDARRMLERAELSAQRKRVRALLLHGAGGGARSWPPSHAAS